jgi:hypothetical protein
MRHTLPLDRPPSVKELTLSKLPIVVQTIAA